MTAREAHPVEYRTTDADIIATVRPRELLTQRDYEETVDRMNLLTQFAAWLIGYLWEPCPVCGRGIAYLNDGRIVAFCSKRRHAEDQPQEDRS